jgi:hypothetical protein
MFLLLCVRYPKDQKWWVKSTHPPTDLGQTLTKEMPDYRMLLWVDFTADQVTFGPDHNR